MSYLDTRTEAQEHDATLKAKRVSIVAGGVPQEVEVMNDVGNPLPVADGGGSLTVDPGVPFPVTDNAGSLTVDDGGIPLSVDDNGGSLTVDGSVAITNAAGAAAVNVQDGGNTITVDGSVTVSNAGAGSAVNIQDGGNTITVDGSVGISTDPVPTKEKICDTNPTATWTNVTNAAVALPAGALALRREVRIYVAPEAAGVVYIGYSNAVVVTANNANRGRPIAPGGEWILEVGPAVTLWGICSAADATLNVLTTEFTRAA